MARDIFYFNGGNYKRGIDDGTHRKPLSCLEAQRVYTDPDHPGEYFNNIQKDELVMSGEGAFDGIAVGDRLYVMLVPQSSGLRGAWVMPQDALAGFTFDVDIVDVCAVSQAMCAETFVEDDVINALTHSSDTLSVDCALGLGDNSCDAQYKAKFAETTVDTYRNPKALQGIYYSAPKILGINQSGYMRLTVTAVPAAGVLDGSCGACGGEAGLPTLQMGIIVDELAVDAQKMATYCTCRERICAGCGEDCDESENCHEQTDFTPE